MAGSRSTEIGISRSTRTSNGAFPIRWSGVHAYACLSLPKRPPADERNRVFPLGLVPARVRDACPAARFRGCCCISAPSITPPGMVERQARVAQHEGGYTPFCADITEFLDADRAADRGRARGRRSRRPLQAARQTGLAASSALHLVSAHHGHLADRLAGTGARPPGSGTSAGHPTWSAGKSASKRASTGERREGLRLNVKLYAGETLLADDTYAVIAGEVHRRIALSDPGIDDYRNELLWSPATPTSFRRS